MKQYNQATGENDGATLVTMIQKIEVHPTQVSSWQAQGWTVEKPIKQ